MLQFLQPGGAKAAEPRVVDAIVDASYLEKASQKEVALMTVYAWKESGAQSLPRPQSWDAKAGVSCGFLQIPCTAAARLSLTGQGRYWLRELRAVGLASLDSDKKRAAARDKLADAALQSATSMD